MGIRNTADLGHALKLLREQAGLSQVTLGEIARLRQRTISDVEQGKGCKTATLFALLTALHGELAVSVRQRGEVRPERY